MVLVGLGLSILLHQGNSKERFAADENNFELAAAFSGVTHISHARQFKHARLSSFFGGIVLDLRQATIDPAGATIDASATCGGAEIRVPVGWQVQVTGAPILGGYDAQALEGEALPPDAPRLRINVSAFCGGLAVKH
jgi:hypothetical protein